MSVKLRKHSIIILLFILLIVIVYIFYPNPPVRELTILYPYDETLFPPDIAAPTFRWEDKNTNVNRWIIRIDFQDDNNPLEIQSSVMEWAPDPDQWESIKEKSFEKNAQITITGFKKRLGVKKVRSEQSLVIKTSSDEVGAPIFFRSVTLPFGFAIANMETIKWCLGDISSEEPPQVVLENMEMCGNCHSFSADGKKMGMDVDYGSDKGSYIITDVAEDMMLITDKIITWSDYKKDDGESTYGLLSQISPDGRYSVSTVKDRSVFVPVDNLYYSQLFFPLRGILAYYDIETKSFHAIPGADNSEYVQSNPSWSPDGNYILFSRNKAGELKEDNNELILSLDQCEEFVSRENLFLFDIYRIPFNNGKGGKAVPLEGASNNGKSNYFARYSPDGKWIVFCQAESFMLLQPDSKLYIMPAEGGEPRLMNCNSDEMNSWHSWSPNGRWLVFSSKRISPYTQLFLTHIDENGNDTPPVLISSFISPDRAINIPEFANIEPDAIKQMHEVFIDYASYSEKGHELMTLGEFEKAESRFLKAVELNPNYAEGYHSLATYHLKMNKIDEAEWEIKRSIELDPSVPSAHHNLGLIYMRQKKPSEAKKAFEIALSYDPEYAPAHEGMGALLLEEGDIEKARQEFETAVKYVSALPFSQYQLGNMYLDNGEYDKAKDALIKSIGINEDRLNSLQELGIEYVTNKELDKAQKVFEIYIEINSGNPSVFHNLAMIHLNNEEYDRAQTLFEDSIKLDPKNYHAFHNLAKIYINKEEYGKAESSFKAALEIESQNVQVLYDLGIFYMNTEDYTKAQQTFRTIYQMNPNNPKVCYMLGKVYSMNDQSTREAISMYSKAISLQPSYVDAHIELGNMFVKSGDNTRAIAEYETALKLDPGNQELKQHIASMMQ